MGLQPRTQLNVDNFKHKTHLHTRMSRLGLAARQRTNHGDMLGRFCWRSTVTSQATSTSQVCACMCVHVPLTTTNNGHGLCRIHGRFRLRRDRSGAVYGDCMQSTRAHTHACTYTCTHMYTQVSDILEHMHRHRRQTAQRTVAGEPLWWEN